MKRALLLSLIALTGCATTEAVPRVETYAINVPVAVSCVPDDFPARAPGLTEGHGRSIQSHSP